MKKVLLSVAVVALMGLSSCGGASLCDCVNMEQDKLTDECKEMQKEFKAKYKEASDEEKESMRKESDACKGEKEEEGEH